MIKTSRVPNKARLVKTISDKSVSHQMRSLSVVNLAPCQIQYPSHDQLATAIDCLKDNLKNSKVICKLANRLETLLSLDKGLAAAQKRVAQDFILAYKQSLSKIPSPKKAVTDQETTIEPEHFVNLLIQIRLSNLWKNSNSGGSSGLLYLRKSNELTDNKEIVFQSLRSIQRYLNHLSYNHVGSIQLFTIKKSQPMYLLVRTAKEIIKQGLPIKCLEAVIVAIFLALDLRKHGFKMFPLAFKTVLKADEGVRDRYFLHIVLIVYFEGRFGALGLSRKNDLMNKSPTFRSLKDLIEEYRFCYEIHGHQVVRLRMGESITQTVNEPGPLDWRFSELNLPRKDWNPALVDVFTTKYVRDQID